MFSGAGYTEYSLTPPTGITISQRARRQTTALRSTMTDQLSFRFRTESSSGVLFHVGSEAGVGGGDFAYVEIQDGGRIAYHINLGSGEEVVTLPDGFPAVDDAVWHLLEVRRSALDLELALDSEVLSHALSGIGLYLDVGYDRFYAGGVPDQGGVARAYTGCLEDIRVDQMALPTSGSNGFASVAFRGNTSSVRIGCALRGCFPNPCGEGGTCVEDGATEFVCSCEDGRRVASMACVRVPTVTPYLLVIVVAAAIIAVLLILILGILGECGGMSGGDTG